MVNRNATALLNQESDGPHEGILLLPLSRSQHWFENFGLWKVWQSKRHLVSRNHVAGTWFKQISWMITKSLWLQVDKANLFSSYHVDANFSIFLCWISTLMTAAFNRHLLRQVFFPWWELKWYQLNPNASLSIHELCSSFLPRLWGSEDQPGKLPCHFHPFHTFWKRINSTSFFSKIRILASLKWFQGFQANTFVEVFVWWILFFVLFRSSNTRVPTHFWVANWVSKLENWKVFITWHDGHNPQSQMECMKPK